jgi:hypothetical protein
MTVQTPDGFVSVSKDAFYAKVGPMNVHPRPDRDKTTWETPERALIGISFPGYLGNSPKAYFLRTS